jgi:NitT/TauT family transport system substrate-binding protein
MEPIKLGIGVSSIGRFLPLVGKAAGVFQQERITVEIVNQRDEEKVVQDIVSGATPIGTPNAPSLIFSCLEGNDLVIVGGVLNRPAFFLVASPSSSIRTIADLKGKRVGINQPRRMAGMVMLALLRRWELTPHRDLALIDLGLNDRSAEALQRGELDAALLPPEKAFLAETDGCRIVADSCDLDLNWVPLATTRHFLRVNRDLVGKIAACYRESVRLFKERRQESLDIIGRALPALAQKSPVLEKCRDLFAEIFEDSLAPSSRSVTAVIEEAALQDVRARNLTPETIIEKVL